MQMVHTIVSLPLSMVTEYGVEQWRHWEVRMAPIFGAKIYKPVLPQLS